MDKAVGQTITLYRTTPSTGAEKSGRTKGLAANGGIVLQIGDRIEVLRDDGLPVRAVFDRLPPNLRARPTLSVTVDAAQAGTVPARLSYLTPNLKSEEHTSELQSLMRITYAVFCLKKKNSRPHDP